MAGVVLASLLLAFPDNSNAAQCKFDDVRIPLVHGEWKPGGRPKYREQDCPGFVHLSSCLQQSKNVTKTRAEYDQHFEPEGCSLREWKATAFLECMKQKGKRRIILIGDSMQWSFFEAWACLLHEQVDR